MVSLDQEKKLNTRVFPFHSNKLMWTPQALKMGSEAILKSTNVEQNQLKIQGEITRKDRRNRKKPQMLIFMFHS